MSLILLRNLLWYRRPVASSCKTDTAASTSGAPTTGNVIIPPLAVLKNAGETCVLTSGVDLEAQTATDGSSPTSTEPPRCSSRAPSSSSSKVTIFLRQKSIAIKNFRPTARMVSDAIIGLSDGMTVPFALTAGLSSFGDTRIVQLGGIAELVAGMISMGVGGALGAKAESDGYKAKLADTVKQVVQSSAEAVALVHDVLRPFGFDLPQRDTIAHNLMQSSDRMVDFLMRFHYQEKRPDPSRPMACGFTIGIGYAVGGLIPLIPYFCVERNQVLVALYISIGIMAVTLFIFGFFKTVLLAEADRDRSTWKAFLGGFEMLAVGGGAAAVAVGIVHGINMSMTD
ncbi:MAG: hypothetical protein Q9211_004645 [Gyalolechia sp. 1 TL-2023]